MAQGSVHPSVHTAQLLVLVRLRPLQLSFFACQCERVSMGRQWERPLWDCLCFLLSNPTDVHTHSLCVKSAAPVLSAEARTRWNEREDQVLVVASGAFPFLVLKRMGSVQYRLILV